MPKVILDTSALVAVVLDEQHGPELRDLMAGHDLVAATTLEYEACNALVGLHRRGRLTTTQVQQGLSIIDMIPVQTEKCDIGRAATIAMEEGIYAYDAFMLERAETHGAPLMAIDLRLRRTARERGLKVLPERIPGDERFE